MRRKSTARRTSVYQRIAEARLGRELFPWEDVHHKDLNHANNDPENLQVMFRAAHHRIHGNIRHMKAKYSKHRWDLWLHNVQYNMEDILLSPLLKMDLSELAGG